VGLKFPNFFVFGVTLDDLSFDVTLVSSVGICSCKSAKTLKLVELDRVKKVQKGQVPKQETRPGNLKDTLCKKNGTPSGHGGSKTGKDLSKNPAR